MDHFLTADMYDSSNSDKYTNKSIGYELIPIVDKQGYAKGSRFDPLARSMITRMRSFQTNYARLEHDRNQAFERLEKLKQQLIENVNTTVNEIKLSSFSDEPGIVQTINYDNNKPKTVTQYGYDGTTILSQKDIPYDARGRIETVTDRIDANDDAVTSYAYSDCSTLDYSNLVYDGEFVQSEDDPNFVFNICITDPNGKDTWISLNEEGKRRNTLYPSGDYELIQLYGHGLPYRKSVFKNDGTCEWIEFEYDEFGKVSRKTYPDGGYVDYGDEH